MAEEQAVIQYLDKKPYFGESSYKDKDEIKRLMGVNTCRFNKDLKCWGTVSLWDVLVLIKSGIWWPRGIDRSWGPILCCQLRKKLDAESKEHETRAENKSKKARSLVAYDGPSREEREKTEKERSLGFVENTHEELILLKNAGVKRTTIDASIEWEELPGRLGSLGPRCGISSAGRILRLFAFEHTRIRTCNPVGTDISKLTAESDRKLADELNALVGVTFTFTTKKKNHQYVNLLADDDVSSVVVNTTNDKSSFVSKPWTNPPKLVRGTCRGCWKALDVQFLECACRDGWVVCRLCPEGRSIVHPAIQPCKHVKL